mmetsp:Transcript_16515/g.37117  ORF Transcript_16515/g.37117 Transcript_16515/m.37117 type:complete len:463 (-) Transcript_16515:396-1784(-)|eukprot:CAMPEP_0113319912 /NCGR_PEP_ID=MMETSP0010_2-20120614/13921_1 /TAXON_ID=216773 ORGANISM="Corethron hystrix, Strain 308" /NCGR_SAMPLE_ID=MMETSP0010_2 /ASSEMBLY_ACC=CAM_ASM_000155 /LENGTH=462 /DNA_ID=CAMNT_0000177569 /DNA_START=56 /DNA_END=1444 /DNA_ORIENTATION=- /assembly_acc=CAM_ASM_000155
MKDSNYANHGSDLSGSGRSVPFELVSQIGALSSHVQKTTKQLAMQKVLEIFGNATPIALPNANDGSVHTLLSHMNHQNIQQINTNNVAHSSNIQAQLLLPLYLQQLNGAIPSSQQNVDLHSFLPGLSNQNTTSTSQSQSQNAVNALLDDIVKGTHTLGQPQILQINASVLAGSQATQSETGIHSKFTEADGSPEFFPFKLHRLVERAEIEGYAHIISFLPHGRSFMIHKPHKFMSEIVPLFFRHSKLTSFQRQLSHYGFKRYTDGVENGAYYHPKFHRGRADLCSCIKRTKVKSSPLARRFARPELPLSTTGQSTEKKDSDRQAEGSQVTSNTVTSSQEGANLQTPDPLISVLSSFVARGGLNVDPSLNASTRSEIEPNVLTTLIAQQQQNFLQQQQASALIGNNIIGNVNHNNTQLLNMFLQPQNSVGGNLFPTGIPTTNFNQRCAPISNENSGSNIFLFK